MHAPMVFARVIAVVSRQKVGGAGGDLAVGIDPCALKEEGVLTTDNFLILSLPGGAVMSIMGIQVRVSGSQPCRARRVEPGPKVSSRACRTSPVPAAPGSLR